MNKKKSESSGRKSVCTIDVIFNLTEVTGKMFFRETKASGTIEDTHFSLDAAVAGGHQIITIGERVFLLTAEEIISKLYTSIFNSNDLSGWIRVEDQMPDDDIEVLVFRESLGDMYLAHHEDGAWITDSSDEIAKVTHYMEPIPPTSSLQPKD